MANSSVYELLLSLKSNPGKVLDLKNFALGFLFVCVEPHPTMLSILRGVPSGGTWRTI